MKYLPQHLMKKLPKARDKFAYDNELDHGGHMSMKLTAVGCMDRHTDHTREEEMNHVIESSEFGLGAWRGEKQLLSQVHRLLRCGCRIRARRNVSERLDSFVRRHAHLLEN